MPQGDGVPQHLKYDFARPEISIPPVYTDPAIEYPDFHSFEGSPERETPERHAEPVTIGRGHYVAADATLPDPAHAAVHLSPLERALLGGTTVETHSDGEVALEPVVLDSGMFENVDVQRALAAFETPTRIEGWAALTASQSPRISFVREFNDALAEHSAEGTPFMALALRMPDGHPAGRRFHFVISTIERSIGTNDRALSDERGRRVVVLLRNAGEDAAHALFATITSELREATAEADHVLQTAKAVIVHNGAPFPNATEFLAHVYD